MAIVYLSLGSNIGDRVGYVQQATSLLGGNPNINIVATSSFYETEPWQMDSNNWFVNAVVQISTKLTAQELLDECHRIEALLGRKRNPDGKNYTDRTIDIDILFYDKSMIKTDTLTIPHSMVHRRVFVLVPMLEIAEDFVHPVFNKTISELYEDMENPEMVYLYGTRI
ncbi:MAG: 2-amino-4-hydroxy-6-hydroxymethyldihydropteridine diphosphokinase [bacterium]|nr:2-amino-4-hydroxy-6-hydroxymethyldihydropteridine diphosphokinase [bacterium]